MAATRLRCPKCGCDRFFYMPTMSTWDQGHRVYKCEANGHFVTVQEKTKYEESIVVYLEDHDEVIG